MFDSPSTVQSSSDCCNPVMKKLIVFFLVEKKTKQNTKI